MDKNSIVRLVIFVLAWLNGLLASKGLKTIPVLDNEQVAGVIAFLVSAYTFYKHNFFGKHGKALKDAIIKESEVVIEKAIDSKVEQTIAPSPAPVTQPAPQPTAPTEQQPK